MDVSGGKNLTPTETVSVGVQPSSFSVPFWCYVGQSWANLGPFGIYFGPMLGHLVGYVALHGRLWRQKFNPNRNCFG